MTIVAARSRTRYHVAHACSRTLLVARRPRRDGGFPPLMLDPIDFNALYFSQLEQQQAAMGEPAGQA